MQQHSTLPSDIKFCATPCVFLTSYLFLCPDSRLADCLINVTIVTLFNLQTLPIVKWILALSTLV
jgi:hypothetical protein